VRAEGSRLLLERPREHRGGVFGGGNDGINGFNVIEDEVRLRGVKEGP
jgi:hypothetical protein